MKKILHLALLLGLATAAFAQDETIKGLKEEAARNIKKTGDDTLTWRKGGIYNLNLAQGLPEQLGCRR